MASFKTPQQVKRRKGKKVKTRKENTGREKIQVEGGAGRRPCRSEVGKGKLVAGQVGGQARVGLGDVVTNLLSQGSWLTESIC